MQNKRKLCLLRNKGEILGQERSARIVAMRVRGFYKMKKLDYESVYARCLSKLIINEDLGMLDSSEGTSGLGTKIRSLVRREKYKLVFEDEAIKR